MVISLQKIAQDAHNTVGNTFAPSLLKTMWVYTPGVIGEDYAVDPVLNEDGTPVSGIVVSISEKFLRQPRYSGVETFVLINRTAAEIQTNSHIEWSGVRYQIKTLDNIADVEWRVGVAQL